MSRTINFSNIIGFLIGLGFFSFSIVLSIKVLQDSSEYIIGHTIVILGFLFLSYLFISTAICRFQYDMLENNRIVQSDIENRELRIINSENNEIELNRYNVDNVELYYSWNTNPFSSDLGHSKILLKDNSTQFITQNEIHQSDVKRIFGKLATEKKSKFKHYIK